MLWLLLYAPPEHHPRIARRTPTSSRTRRKPTSGSRLRSSGIGRRAFLLAEGHHRPGVVVLSVLAAQILNAEHGIELSQVALPLIVVYLAADRGSIGGGGCRALPETRLVGQRARKLAMPL